MKNDKKFLKQGFSILELLIGLLITAVIAAALVPVVGLKRVKSPLNKFYHGMAQCYYVPLNSSGSRVTQKDENGDLVGVESYQLRYFYTDNNPNSEPVDVPAGNNYCTFSVPNADFYEIIAIGAGGAGSEDGDVSFEQNGMSGTAAQGYSGIIHSDDRFQKDIKNATIGAVSSNQGIGVNISGQLRALLNKWAKDEDHKRELYALYHMESPLGEGGRGACVSEVLDACSEQACDKRGDNDQCPGPFKYNYLDYKLGTNGYEVADENTRQEDIVMSTRDIGGSFYTKDSAEQLARENRGTNCWYFYHAMGFDSGYGILTAEHTPLKMYLNGWSDIQTENKVGKDDINPSNTYVKITVANIQNKDDHRFLTLRASENGASNYDYRNGLFTIPSGIRPAARAKCESSGNLAFGDQNNINPCTNIDNPNAENYIIKGARNLGAKGGREEASIGMCEATETSAKRGVIRAVNESGGTINDFEFLSWAYRSPLYSATFGHGGTPGVERSVVLESMKVGKKIYLYPTPTNYTSNGDLSKSYVSLSNGVDTEQKILIQAESGGNGVSEAMDFTVFQTEIPIPKVPLALAKPDNRQKFQYLSKIENVSKRGAKGITSCNDNTCPGFGGNGVYLYLTQAPGAKITLTNNTNGVSYTDEPDTNTPIPNYILDNPKCDDGATTPRMFGNWGECREGRRMGNPGAIIIIW